MYRFIVAHNHTYDNAIAELKNGYKETHWMWFIFPQFAGLSSSHYGIYYAIKNKYELNKYVANKTLRNHMDECIDVLLNLPTNDAVQIFGSIDAAKLKSSMTLFSHSRYFRIRCNKVLQKFFNGDRCNYTDVLFT